MKKLMYGVLALMLLSLKVSASVPTEEGLLKNLNNADLPGQFITLKMMVQGPAEQEKNDFVKLIISLENPPSVSMLQIIYSNAQMLNSQVRNVKFIPDLLTQIKKEKVQERAMFYAVLMMLTTNRSSGMESFLEKNGVSIIRNKTVLNEEKMKLLRAYRTHLANSKGRGETGSPLNPDDPKNKEKVLELFRSNTFKRSPNIELVKKDNEFMWKADWKIVQGYFSNEERRFRQLELNGVDGQIRMEASTYVLFNGVNELPKFINFKDIKGLNYKVQILGLDNKLRADKKMSLTYEELKKFPSEDVGQYPFLL